MISISIPSLIVMLTITNNSADKLERELIEEIDIRAEHLRERVENYQSYHVKAMKTFALALTGGIPEDKQQQMMEHWINNYPGFITMMSTDRDGQVINGVPREVFEKLLQLSEESKNVSDRDYFTVARDTGMAYVSGVFKGRGFGNDPIVAVSVPLYKDKQFHGVVEGSLNLPKFENIDNSGGDSSILVVDSKQQVIYGSADLKLEPLDLVSIKENSQQYSNSIQSMILNDVGVFNYKYIETSNGWLIYILSPFDELLVAYRNSFYGLLLGIVFISLIASRVAHRLSHHITSPLERLVSYFSAGLTVPDKAASYYSSQEIETVRLQLQEAQHIMIDFQEKLKQQVSDKTEELVKLNDELEKLSSHDPLTGILNRRGFEQSIESVYPIACRNKTPMTIAIIDLDKFKKVNDDYGHNIGDTCLVAVGTLLKEVFQRESDVVSRFGGEEFIVMIIGHPVDNHHQLLEEFRKKVESLSVDCSGRTISFTVSIGAYSQIERFEPDYQKVVSEADKLLYRAKEAGRNQVKHRSE
ncbi:GGDEF domain-containing protein [Kangiella sp. HD9-110m-PIT-SAG07]|nr:GGDEF domain-containing protein [Kangiella sp. HD9-110m-PIT-SAG07]